MAPLYEETYLAPLYEETGNFLVSLFFLSLAKRSIMLGRIKTHLREHKEAYIRLSIGVGVAGITLLIMRSRSDFSISPVIHGTAKRGLAVPGETSVNALEVNRGGTVLGNSYALNNVSFISSDRQGPPSWVVRCLENDLICTSQQAMALAMNLPASEISKHLNGVLDNVQGYHFERICMAA